MTNIVQLSEMLKDVSDKRLEREVRQPTGVFPPYLPLTEIDRRRDLRARFRGEHAQPPQTTVQDDLLAMLAQQTQRPGLPPAASQGLGGAVPQGPGAPVPQGGPAVPAPMGVPPVVQPRLPPAMPPQGSLGNTQGFADGGMVRGYHAAPTAGWGYNPYSAPTVSPMSDIGQTAAARAYSGIPIQSRPSDYDKSLAEIQYQTDVLTSQRRGGSVGAEEYGPPAPSIDAKIHSTFTSPLGKSGILTDVSSGTDSAAMPNLNLPTAPSFKNIKPFSEGVATNLAEIGRTRGDPLAKFQQILDDRKAKGEEVDDKRFWRDVALAGFTTAAQKGQFLGPNIAAGGLAFGEARDKSEAIATARKDKDLQLGLTLATAKEDLYAKRQQIAVELQKGNMSVEAANQASKMAVSEFELSKTKIAQTAQIAAARDRTTIAVAEKQAGVPSAFGKSLRQIQNMPEKTAKQRADKAEAKALFKQSVDRSSTGMRLTRSQATAASNRRNKRFDEVLDYNKSGDAKNSKIMNTEVTKGMTVGEALQSMDDAKIQKAMPIIRAMVDKEMESDADYLEGVELGYIKPYSRPGRGQQGGKKVPPPAGSTVR